MPRSKSTIFAVWPYFFLSGISGLLGLLLIFIGWPGNYPAKSELVKISGKIATVSIRDNISNSTAGAMLPGFTAVYFTLEGIPGEFRYSYDNPKYPLVRDYTAGVLDIWINGSEMGDQLPKNIWQLQERNGFTSLYPDTSVTYEEVIERLTRVDHSIFKFGLWLTVVFCVFTFAGIGGVWFRNR